MRIVPEQQQKLKRGEKWHRLTVIGEPFYARQHGERSRQFAVFECDCGIVVCVFLRDLFRGRTKSCGCLSKELASARLARFNASGKNKGKYRHGSSYTRLYYTWEAMKARCCNPKHQKYRWYGGKGIRVCDEWLTFEGFRDWALANGYADNLTIDRKESDGNYEPANCQWLTKSENSRKSNKQKRIATP